MPTRTWSWTIAGYHPQRHALHHNMIVTVIKPQSLKSATLHSGRRSRNFSLTLERPRELPQCLVSPARLTMSSTELEAELALIIQGFNDANATRYLTSSSPLYFVTQVPLKTKLSLNSWRDHPGNLRPHSYTRGWTSICLEGRALIF